MPPLLIAVATASSTRRDFPMPASPRTSTSGAIDVVCPVPSASQRACRWSRSARRPTNGDRDDAGGVQAVDRAGRPHDAEHLHRAFDPLHRGCPERLDVEVAADDLVGVVADRDRAVGRDGLDARRLVRRRADHRVALGAHLGRDVADEHETGVDPDPRRELDPVLAPDGRVEVLERGEQLEAREHRLTGVVLTRRGEAEVGHDAVARVLREVTVMLGDDPAAPLAVVLEQVADLLGLVALRHRRGSDEVDEHHGELAALAAAVVPSRSTPAPPVEPGSPAGFGHARCTTPPA